MIARWFWREWRSPSLLIVWLALSLAVACVLALGSVSDRMEKGLSQQSREFMAGDRTLQSSRAVPPGWIDEARKRGLKVGEQISFQTMTFAGDTPQLASVKAVDDIYPMYGELQTSPSGLKPKPGTVLLAPRLIRLCLTTKFGTNHGSYLPNAGYVSSCSKNREQRRAVFGFTSLSMGFVDYSY